MSPLSSTATSDRGQRLHLLHEDQIAPRPPRVTYEREGSERVAKGSVALPSGGWWFGSLEVGMSGNQGALLTILRAGAGAGPAPSEASVVIPLGEADALLTLLTGLVAHARADGVLEQGAEARPRRKLRSAPSRREAPPAAG